MLLGDDQSNILSTEQQNQTQRIAFTSDTLSRYVNRGVFKCLHLIISGIATFDDEMA